METVAAAYKNRHASKKRAERGRLYELSPAENFFAELLRFGQKLNDDDGRDDESVDHKDKSE